MTLLLDRPAPARPGRLLAAAQLAGSLGDGAFLTCSVLFFTRIAGLTPAQVGLGLTLGWAVGSVAGVPLGHLADRHGARGSAVLLALATGASILAFLFVRTPVPFVVAACVYGSCQTGLAAVRQALLAALADPRHRTRIRAHLQSAGNAGLAVGAGLGGLALSADTASAYLTVFVFDAAGFAVTAVLLSRLPVVPRSASPRTGEPKLAVLRDRPYALVTLLNAILLLRMPLLSVAIPLWIAERTAAPGWTVSALFVLNTVVVVLLQVRVAGRLASIGAAARMVRHSGVLLLASCVAFALSASGTSPWTAFTVLVAGALVQVLGEMLQSAGTWEIGFALAPAAKQGQYQGFFGTGVSVARAVGPALLSTTVIGWGTPGWLLLGALFLTAGYAMGPAVRWAQATAGTP
ncbi:MFS transporter [Amycolatopsis australiensis]|uniref:Major Facilitator Superfamily protein n=1 Tax=Amycolatopsis australiensis TaxID=546364 RepID=A0A1K1SK52_9PSEU|nr:MFS transporter [Amycolatopsis australiensis]SFW84739.1 Major Facilitator Superfamily protein [Amycolatopsis australiensis]